MLESPVESFPCPDSEAVKTCLDRLRVFVEEADYAGYDPYDALNSALIRRLSGHSKWLGVAATQTLRRLPVNLRPLLGIQPEHNPKALGLFLWGYARLFALERDQAYLDRIDYLLKLLERSMSKGYSGHCWGYNFDWRNRTMWTPRYTPTIVNTAFIGHALLDTYRLAGVDLALEMALGTSDFLCHDLTRHEDPNGLCLSYTPLNGDYVHNANLLGASLLIRLHGICGAQELKDLALACLEYGLHHQRPDGAWYYGQMHLMRYVDSFHTGFNLQALQYFLRAGYGPDCRRAYERGLAYYVNHFFLADGSAKYYDNKVFPLDIHSFCQAVVVLSDPLAGQVELCARVLDSMLRQMWSPHGYFYFRRGHFYANKICYMRWSQAWAFHALTCYLHNEAQNSAADAAGSPYHAHLD